MRSLMNTGWINFRMRAMLISHATFGLGYTGTNPPCTWRGLFTDFEPGIHYPQVQVLQAGVRASTRCECITPSNRRRITTPHWRVCRPLGAGINSSAIRVARQTLGTAGKPAKTVRLSAWRKLPNPQNDFETEARHWKKMLYELRRTPDAREASQAIRG